MSKWYEQEKTAVLQTLDVSEGDGLAEAAVQERRRQYGRNEFEKQQRDSVAHMVLNQLRDVSNLILLIAAVLSFALAAKEGEGFVEPVIITAIILMNMTLSITQERSAEKALEALSGLNRPACQVIRDGSRQEISTADLVPGDLILLETGDLVPADGRLLSSTDLTLDESSLTGESEASVKDANAVLEGRVLPGDQVNMVFSGCLVTAGRGIAVVTETGMQTQMGRIAGYLNSRQKIKTPLQHRLDRIAKAISFIAIISALALFAVGIRQGEDFWGMIFMAVTLAVAAVPETLALIVTLTLTQGVKNMVNRNALIRKLQAVETLGSTSVICTDKTGTLTQNRMTVKRLWRESGPVWRDTDDFTEEQMHFLIRLALASNATAEQEADGTLNVSGDATETAIIRLLAEKGLSREQLEQQYPRIAEIPFSSERKIMTTVHENPDGGYLVLTKGAADRLPLAESQEEQAAMQGNMHDTFAKDALRVLALGSRLVRSLPPEDRLAELEQDLNFEGFIGLIDPPRPEVAEAIVKAKRAGIRVVMITGDHVVTASAIARELGILGLGDRVLTGYELAEMSDEELCCSVRQYSVYARVSPEDKIRIVEAWQENGEVVAMTGDGVNDAPALNAADVGVAMGRTGTEVAKSAADMILTDDNFATIVEAVQEGRNVYAIIRKTIYFLLTCNFSEIMIMLGAQIVGWGGIVTPIMLLLINVIGDGIPGLQLAKERSAPSIMNRNPVGRNENIFNGGLLGRIMRQAIVFAVVTWIGYYIGAFLIVSKGWAPSHQIGQTVTFLILGFTSILHILTVRSRSSIRTYRISDNPMLYAGSAATLALFALLALIPPVAALFGLTAISGTHWIIVGLLSAVPTAIAEAAKFIDRTCNERLYKNRVVRHREDVE